MYIRMIRNKLLAEGICDEIKTPFSTEVFRFARGKGTLKALEYFPEDALKVMALLDYEGCRCLDDVVKRWKFMSCSTFDPYCNSEHALPALVLEPGVLLVMPSYGRFVLSNDWEADFIQYSSFIDLSRITCGLNGKAAPSIVEDFLVFSQFLSAGLYSDKFRDIMYSDFDLLQKAFVHITRGIGYNVSHTLTDFSEYFEVKVGEHLNGSTVYALTEYSGVYCKFTVSKDSIRICTEKCDGDRDTLIIRIPHTIEYIMPIKPALLTMGLAIKGILFDNGVAIPPNDLDTLSEYATGMCVVDTFDKLLSIR